MGNEGGVKMEMPTVCECGEVVEFDDMLAIGNELVCVDCYNDKEEKE